jgi:hypothetical protein
MKIQQLNAEIDSLREALTARDLTHEEALSKAQTVIRIINGELETLAMTSHEEKIQIETDAAEALAARDLAHQEALSELEDALKDAQTRLQAASQQLDIQEANLTISNEEHTAAVKDAKTQRKETKKELDAARKLVDFHMTTIEERNETIAELEETGVLLEEQVRNGDHSLRLAKEQLKTQTMTTFVFKTYDGLSFTPLPVPYESLTVEVKEHGEYEITCRSEGKDQPLLHEPPAAYTRPSPSKMPSHEAEEEDPPLAHQHQEPLDEEDHEEDEE